MKLGLALLRVIVGGLFVGHGLQKLAGWFGGHGLAKTGESFESMGLRPGVVHAGAAGASEAVGGALLSAGLLTPVGSSLVSATMITAIRKVHAPNGPWATKGGYEYNLVLLAAAFVLAELGPGAFSLDEALGTERKGLGWALAELALGALGSSAVLALAQRTPNPEYAGSEPTQEQDGDAAAQAPNGQPARA